MKSPVCSSRRLGNDTHTHTHTHLKGFVEPENRAGRHVAYPVQVPRYQVGLVEPAAEHVVRLVPHTREQCVVFCGAIREQVKSTHAEIEWY